MKRDVSESERGPGGTDGAADYTTASRGSPAVRGSPRPTRRHGARKPRIGLALAGGGPLGGIFETGALLALDDAIGGLDLLGLEVYVGVSAGSFFAASLANRVGPRELHRIFIENAGTDYPMPPELFLTPAWRELGRRAAKLPGFAAKGLRQWLRSPFGNSPLELIGELAHAIPTGLCDPAPLERQLARLFSTPGRTNDFRKLPCKLFLPVVDLDTAELRVMGAEGSQHFPISKCITACAALPGLFPPVRIAGHDYVDGGLLKTVHASIALDEGLDLLLCINPLVPYDARLARLHGRNRYRRLRDAGFPAVLSQAFRTLIISRMRTGMAQYATRYPKSDVVLFEAARDDGEMFFSNLMRYSKRRAVVEHAYVETIRNLAARRDELDPILGKHGLWLRDDVLLRAKPDVPALRAARNRPAAANEIARRIDDIEAKLREKMGSEWSSGRRTKGRSEMAAAVP